MVREVEVAVVAEEEELEVHRQDLQQRLRLDNQITRSSFHPLPRLVTTSSTLITIREPQLLPSFTGLNDQQRRHCMVA